MKFKTELWQTWRSILQAMYHKGQHFWNIFKASVKNPIIRVQMIYPVRQTEWQAILDIQ